MENLYSDINEEVEFTKAYIQNMYYFFGYGIWVVCLKENDEIIGRAGISNREVNGVNKLELGYVIAVPYQNKGYATECCEAICDFVKNEICEKEIVCFTNKNNLPSMRVAEKLGFKYIKDVAYDEKNEEKMFAYYKKIL